MSIIVSHEDGWVVDHLSASRTRLQHATGDDMIQCGLKPALFQVLTPYKMDSQFQKLNEQATHSTCGGSRKRKRKRKEPLNDSELLAVEYHNQVKGYIHQSYSSLVTMARQLKYFQPLSDILPADNNLQCRRAAANARVTDWFINLSLSQNQPAIADCILQQEICHGTKIGQESAMNVLWHHKGEHSVLIKSGQEEFIVPAQCSFLMSDMKYLTQATHALGRYDLIVMDPPWFNGSVDRKRKYSMLNNDAVLTLPLQELMLPGCLVVVWVTNKHSNITFVTKQLFPHKRINFVARWFWLKVTKDGQCVQDIDCPHKKPYETIFIGRYAGENIEQHCKYVTNSLENDQTGQIDSEMCRCQCGSNTCECWNHADEACKYVDKNTNCCTGQNKTLKCQSECVQCNNENNSNSKHYYRTANTGESVGIEYPGENGKSCDCCSSVNTDTCDTDITASHSCKACSKCPRDAISGASREAGVGTNDTSKPTGENRSQSSISTDDRSTSKQIGEDCCQRSVPNNKVIISVPCAIHSKKPPLFEMLKAYLPSKPRCLEMFARNLLPHWTSWGNEVLLHQHVDFHETNLKPEVKFVCPDL